QSGHSITMRARQTAAQYWPDENMSLLDTYSNFSKNDETASQISLNQPSPPANVIVLRKFKVETLQSGHSLLGSFKGDCLYSFARRLESDIVRRSCFGRPTRRTSYGQGVIAALAWPSHPTRSCETLV